MYRQHGCLAPYDAHLFMSIWRTYSTDATLPEVIEAIPWDTRDLDWLASSLGYLGSVVPTLIDSTYDPATMVGSLPRLREAAPQ